jgi:hypothetical protein
MLAISRQVSSLCLSAWRFNPLHASFSLARRLVGVLAPIVQIMALTIDRQKDLIEVPFVARRGWALRACHRNDKASPVDIPSPVDISSSPTHRFSLLDASR